MLRVSGACKLYSVVRILDGIVYSFICLVLRGMQAPMRMFRILINTLADLILRYYSLCAPDHAGSDV